MKTLMVNTTDHQTVINNVNAWSMKMLKKRLIKEGMNEVEAELLIAEYRKYMVISILYPDHRHPMCRRVDEVWHQHILHTKDYLAFCLKVNGAFIHHRPVTSERQRQSLNADYEANTVGHITEVYGSCDRKVWEPKEQLCKCCGNCCD